MSNSDSAPQAPPPSSPGGGASDALARMSIGQKVLLGSAVVLLIDSFLPWYHVSFMSVSSSQNGWHQMGTLAWLLVVVLLAVEGARVAGALPLDAAKGALASAAAGALAVLFGLIFVIQRLSDGFLGFGVWIGIVGLIALAYGVLELVRSGNVMDTVKSMQGKA